MAKHRKVNNLKDISKLYDGLLKSKVVTIDNNITRGAFQRLFMNTPAPVKNLLTLAANQNARHISNIADVGTATDLYREPDQIKITMAMQGRGYNQKPVLRVMQLKQSVGSKPIFGKPKTLNPFKAGEAAGVKVSPNQIRFHKGGKAVMMREEPIDIPSPIDLSQSQSTQGFDDDPEMTIAQAGLDFEGKLQKTYNKEKFGGRTTLGEFLKNGLELIRKHLKVLQDIKKTIDTHIGKSWDNMFIWAMTYQSSSTVDQRGFVVTWKKVGMQVTDSGAELLAYFNSMRLNMVGKSKTLETMNPKYTQGLKDPFGEAIDILRDVFRDYDVGYKAMMDGQTQTYPIGYFIPLDLGQVKRRVEGEPEVGVIGEGYQAAYEEFSECVTVCDGYVLRLTHIFKCANALRKSLDMSARKYFKLSNIGELKIYTEGRVAAPNADAVAALQNLSEAKRKKYGI